MLAFQKVPATIPQHLQDSASAWNTQLLRKLAKNWINHPEEWKDSYRDEEDLSNQLQAEFDSLCDSIEQEIKICQSQI